MIFALHKTMHTWRATLCIAQDHARLESHSSHCKSALKGKEC